MARNDGIVIDTLFVGPTRPTTIAGVTWPAVLINLIITMECFIWTHDLRWLAICLPIHAVCYLICLRDPRAFELLMLYGQTKAQALLANGRYWRASTYSPLGICVGKRPSRASKRRMKELCK